MGLRYLWDTNTVIYYLQNNFPEAKQAMMSNIINNYQPAISVITQIELLCWKSATNDDTILLNNFISDNVIFELDNEIKLKTIEIRKAFSIKLPDAIIAATAIIMDLSLISFDNRGFKKIPSLDLLNPADTE